MQSTPKANAAAAAAVAGSALKQSSGASDAETPLRLEPESAAVARRLTWLFVFRSLMMGMLLVVTVLVNLSDSAVLTAPPQILLYLAVGTSFAVILAGAVWQRRAPSYRVSHQIYLQIGSDVVVATVLVHATGGVDSAFLFLYSLSAINGAALAYRRGALLTALLAGLSYGALVLASLAGWPLGLEEAHDLGPREAIVSFVYNVSALFLVAMLASYITEQMRRAGETLEETLGDLGRLEALHAAVVDSLTSGLMSVNAEGRVTLLNRAGEQLLGAKGTAVLGRSADSLIPELQRHLERSGKARFETDVHVGTGRRHLGLSVAPLRHPDPGLRGSVVTFQDLTEVRRLEAAFHRSERLATVGRFAAGMAHELRNPLASLVGCVEMLKKAAADESTLEPDAEGRLFEIVLREAERLNRLLSDFLTYARPAKVSRQRLNLVELVAETVAVARREIDSLEQVGLEHTQGSAPVEAFGDISQIKQVLWNLLRNAIQAVQAEGTVRVLVEETRDRQGKLAASVLIEDSGPGVPAELRAKVLEPFFTTKEGGTGLGLPTVLRIIEEHDGELSIGESALGGAAFRVVLPTTEGIEG